MSRTSLQNAIAFQRVLDKLERDIMHENTRYWVSRVDAGFMVWKRGITHSTSVCCFPNVSLAVAYADYKESSDVKRKVSK